MFILFRLMTRIFVPPFRINTFFLRLLASLFLAASFNGHVTGQQNLSRRAEKDTALISIKWKGVEEIRITETEVFRRMAFEDAVYPGDPLIPEWHLLYLHKSRESHLNASLEVISKELLSQAEAGTFNYDTEISNDFVIRVVPVIVKRDRFSSVFISPVRKVREGVFERILTFKLNIDEEPVQSLPSIMHRTGKSVTVLSSGDWYKIRVSRNGIHKIDYQQLSAMGFTGGSSANIRLFGMGGALLPETAGEYRPDGLQEIAVQVVDGGDNSIDPGDYIIFYAEGPGTWIHDSLNNRFVFQPHHYDNYNYYFLTRGTTPGLRIQNQTPPVQPPTTTVNSFQEFYRYENDTINLIKSGKLWVGEVFDLKTTYSINLNIPDINPTTPVEMRTSFVARSLVSSTFTVQSGQFTTVVGVPNILPGYNSPYASMGFQTFTFNTSGNSIPLTITYNKPMSTSIGWLDYIEVNLRRNLRFSGAQLLFRDYSVSGVGATAEYKIAQSAAGTVVWDITNPFMPERVQGNLSGSVYSFTSDASVKRQFVAVSSQGWYNSETAGKVPNQNLRSATQTDMVIVSYPDFLAAAERLANIHRNKSGLSVLVVTPGPIYNEFSSGKKDPTAIRDFMKMFYDRATSPKEMPKYLLFFGDGSYDNKNRMPDNTNFLPTFQSDESLNPAGTFVTDDYFGMLDDHEGLNASGALDLGIGRIPVSTSAEASQMVDKIERYLSDNTVVNVQSISAGTGNTRPLADWRNLICIVADDEDSNLHIDQAEYLADYCDSLHTVYNVNKIYSDAYQQVSISGGHRYPDVNDAINKQMERGALIMNYIGHGGELGWAHERILRIDDIQSWNNNWQMPLFITSTCEFSRFDDPARRSAGEYAFLHPNGGAIALFTTTRLAFASSNYAFNSAFFKQAFNKVSGEYQSLGDIFRMSKILSGSQANNRNIVILGDPALRLVYPKHRIITTHINDTLITYPFDTLKALSKITVKGAVIDQNGQVMQDFDGFLFPNVLDKKMTFTTLGQDQGSYPKQFWMQKNALYRGKVTVSKGLFTFSFIVPKDIAYSYGFGKISYYAENGIEDAHGFFDKIVVGGTADGNITDNTGPVVRLYLNDSSFVFGGTTDADPVILALLSDEHGINTTGGGIGHDIVAVIDGNTNNSIILNDYYEADLDSYNSGMVIYGLSDLEDGPHHLSVKAWDILNNSTEVFTEFVVASADKPILTHVLNWPNPFTTNTEFWFEHNQPCCDLDVMIEVFTISGKIVKTIIETVTFTGYRAGPITWDGLDDYGDRLARGVYIYKVSIRNNEQKRAEKYEKLVILR